jgi:hypothetical protein
MSHTTHVSHVSSVPERLADQARPRRTSPVSRVVSHVPRSLVSESVSRCALWPPASGVAAFAALPVEATALPIYLRLIVTASAVQLDPAHEADARFFKGDRGCWKAWLRSARLTNACGRRPSASLRKVIESPVQHRGQPRRRVFLRSPALSRSRCLLCCPGVTVTALGRPPDRAREGHGQHLGIPSLKSNLDDRDAGYLDLQHFGAVEPLVTIGRVNALMVFKSIPGSRPGGTATCVVSTRGWPAKQDHPPYIPRTLRPVRAVTSLSTSREANDR